jgi:predicted nuclease of predicted toxin-antitoxin system
VKLLLDACVWGGAKKALAAFGHDVTWAGDRPDDPGDEALLSAANAEERVLVTLDKDFGELAVVRGQPHRGIIRLVGISARRQAATCQDVLVRYGDDLKKGALITAEPSRFRVRTQGEAEKL